MQTIALVQFISPTLTMLMGIFNGETIKLPELPAFLIIWLGIGVYIWPVLSSRLRL